MRLIKRIKNADSVYCKCKHTSISSEGVNKLYGYFRHFRSAGCCGCKWSARSSNRQPSVDPRPASGMGRIQNRQKGYLKGRLILAILLGLIAGLVGASPASASPVGFEGCIISFTHTIQVCGELRTGDEGGYENDVYCAYKVNELGYNINHCGYPDCTVDSPSIDDSRLCGPPPGSECGITNLFSGDCMTVLGNFWFTPSQDTKNGFDDAVSEISGKFPFSLFVSANQLLTVPEGEGRACPTGVRHDHVNLAGCVQAGALKFELPGDRTITIFGEAENEGPQSYLGLVRNLTTLVFLATLVFGIVFVIAKKSFTGKDGSII